MSGAADCGFWFARSIADGGLTKARKTRPNGLDNRTEVSGQVTGQDCETLWPNGGDVTSDMCMDSKRRVSLDDEEMVGRTASGTAVEGGTGVLLGPRGVRGERA